MGKKILSAEDIIGSVDIKEEAYEVPEWGGSVKLRPFTKEQQQAMRKKAMVNGELDSDYLEMLLLQEGMLEPKLTDEQLIQVKQKSANVIDNIIRKITAMSGVTEQETKEAEKFFRVK